MARNAKARNKKERQLISDNAARGMLLAILAFALIYSIVFVEGPSFFGDDTVYLDMANAVVHGNFHQSPFIFSVRLLMAYPIGFFYSLFGVSLITSSAWDIISFLGIIVVAFLLGKELHGNLAGIIAALLAGFFPLLVQLSATVSDDIPLAFITSLAMLALLYGQRKASREWYFIAGILLIASPLVTPEGLIIIITAIFYLIVEVLRKKIALDAKLLSLPAGMAAALIVLMLFNFINSGNPLITFTVNTNFYSAVGQQNTIPSTNTDPMFYLQDMFSYGVISNLQAAAHAGIFNPLTIWQSIYMQNPNNAGFFFYVLVLAAIYLILRKERKAYFVLFWFAISFLYLEFGPMHISLVPFSYLLSYRLTRFLTIIAVPTVVVIGIALARLTSRYPKPSSLLGICFASAVAIFLILTSLPINTLWYHTTYAERFDQLAMAQYLNQLPNTTKIYFTGAFSNIHSYMMFDNLSRFYAYDNMQNCTQIPKGAYVLIPKYNKVFTLNYTPNPLPYCPGWKLAMSPQIDQQFSQDIIASAEPFRGNLYYVQTNSSG
ncbi:MAG: glycosyltransferase family 39 protein [Candidatus Micrarchaeota archaeon]|nr:glycosyltransferase family 39 protein [Candidatus Micrarchaeota archaeon]